MATPAGMSWAERAKAKHVSATNQKPGVPPNQASTAPSANGTHPASVPSSSSSRSNPSAHEHEADEETPASSLAPSAASVEDHLEAKPVHKPAPSPSVNIWTLRQQTRQPQPKAPRASPSSTTRSMSTKSHHADSQGDAAATNSNGSQEPAQPQPESRSAGPSGVTTANTALPPSSNDDHNISTSASTTASQSLKGAWKPFKKPVTRDISSENDATAWPSPDAAAASIALDKKKAASTQAQKPESESATDRVKSEKKKGAFPAITSSSSFLAHRSSCVALCEQPSGYQFKLTLQ